MRITLRRWAYQQYGVEAPHIKTLRRWAREGKLFPAPRKDGRTYYIDQNAQYVGDYNSPEFMGRVRDTAQA